MENNQKKRRTLVAGGILTLVIAAAGGLAYYFSRPTPPLFPTPGVSETEVPLPTEEGQSYGLGITLGNDNPQPDVVESNPVVIGESLSPEEVEAILVRLPALTVDSDQQVDFNLPQEVLPPPRPGNTLTETFPPEETGSTPTEVEAGPLQVLRFAPEGEIPIAPFISVTFNQAMVPIGTLGDLAKEDVPVMIEPELPGTWRWLGAKTLTFEYDSELIDRLPKATEFTVTVPAGVKSATGVELAEAVSWKFRTPPPQVLITYPTNEPQPLEPLFFVSFDQRIDPAEVLKTIRVTAGTRDVDLVLASQSEIEDNEKVSALVENALEGRWLAFRATEPFKPETSVSVTIGPGTPSAEGPLTTEVQQVFGFMTYTPLRIDEHHCYWYDDRCPPLTPFYILFNNPLDLETFSESMISVQPEIPGMTINAYSNTIEISGETSGRTTYTVWGSKELQDVFGQKLGSDQAVEFKVDKAEPALIGPGKNFVTLDPSAKTPTLSVYAINYNRLNLTVHAVQPTDWPAFTQYLYEWTQTDAPPPLPGKRLIQDSISIEIPDDTLSQVDIDLSQYLDGKYGQFAIIIEPPAGFFESDEDKWRRFSQTVIVWVQVTQIGLDAYTDHSEMIAWATDLKNGEPLSGVQIQPEVGSPVTTGRDGVARFDIPSGSSYLTASLGDDQAILPSSSYYWYDSSWSSYAVHDSLRWFVFDDRQIYRPGEEVHLKGWIRLIGGGQDGDVGLPGNGLSSINYQVTDPQGNLLGEGSTDLNNVGGFDFAFTVPEQTNLGNAYVNLIAQGNLGVLDGSQSFYHSFQIQEFRTPEFEVTARNETTGPYFVGDHASLAVEAKYYAGGGLPNADVTWQVTKAPGNYSPPNWPDFVFGNWQPWWYYYDYYYQNPVDETQTQTFNGKTDAAGTHFLGMDFQSEGDPAINPQPFSITAYASVMDVNRQAWNSLTTLLVHPANVYIGLRSESYFVEKGTPIEVEFIVTDLDGEPIAERPVEITAGRLEWKYRDGAWVEEVVDSQTCSLLSAPEPGSCSFETPLGGSYRITASVSDETGRRNQSQFTRWVSGGQLPPARNVEKEEVTLIPDKETYQPGDTAKILVQSPFSPAEGLLTLDRSGIVSTMRFEIKDGTATLNIPIEEKYIPNLNIQVDVVGSAPRTDDKGNEMIDVPRRPAFASAQLNLNIPPLERTLELEVSPEINSLEPGSETTVSVLVKDANGRPVPNAELAVVVVDEAILALTNYRLADPLAIFYPNRPATLFSVYARENIVLMDPTALTEQVEQMALFSANSDALAGAEAPAAVEEAAPSATALPQTGGGEAEADRQAQPGIEVRTDFNALAAFLPNERTGPDGVATVRIKLPDNLTRYRIMVVAVDGGGKQFGTGESNLTARLPLMVRPSAPRFLNFGDVFELPVVLQNQTNQPMTVNVALRAANLELENNGQRVTVPANDRVEVRFPASTVMAGLVQVQVAATAGDLADAATVEMPVYTPATSEAFATYGVIDDGAIAQPVLYPTEVFPQYGGLEINTSSTALQSLTDAVLYLVSYPFECSEQLASRILAVASLRDVLTAFKADGLPSPAEMESAVSRDIERLQGMQNFDGGFPYWRRGFESSPFNTVHVAHALFRAEEKGFDVPNAMQLSSLTYLQNIEQYYPSWYSQDTCWTISAYALYVRNLMGDRDAAKAEGLLNEAGLENLSMEAIGWLWPVIDNEGQLEAIRLFVNNHVVETAGAANFTTAYTEQTYLLLSSDRRTDAILLDALIEDNPQSDLIPKVVNGLLAHRTKGRWSNTQENVFVLLTLDRYFRTYEAQTPDFVARFWLGDTYAGEDEFLGRTTDIYETLIPMEYVLSETAAGGGTQDLILDKDGAGRLYYRLALQYAPRDLNLAPLDMGFVVQRRYEGMDDPEDVYQDADGVWHIKAGARVRVTLTLVADNRRYHVALVDPLPAGLEIINPELAVSQSVPQDPTSPNYQYGWWWWGAWYEHQNLRDDRAEAFTSLLWDGVYEYTYIARATTPGTFVVPPAKAEEMYSPEVFGRSGSDWVIVE